MSALSGAQKCAILILLLEEAQAADLLARMDPAEVRAVGEAMLSVAEIDPALIDGVLDEFLERTRGILALDSQGRQVRSVLSRALGTPRADGVIAGLGAPAAVRRFAALDWLEPAGIAALLAEEHPQASAVVLAHLPERRAAAVIDALPDAVQADLVLRLATMKPLDSAVIADLESDIEARLAMMSGSGGEQQLAGADFTARLVNMTSNQKALIAALAGVDEALAARVAEQSFVFADLLQLTRKDMQLVLREADTAVLAVALKGADAALQAAVFGAMSSRAASQLQDDLADRGPMKRSEVDAAQAEVCALVRQLGESGAIMLPGAAAAYV